MKNNNENLRRIALTTKRLRQDFREVLYMPDKIKIFHVKGDSLDDTEFFFTANGELIAHWQTGDAQWRSEYMNPLMAALGVEVVDAPAWKYRTQINKVLGRVALAFPCPYYGCGQSFNSDGERFEHEREHKRKKMQGERIL